MKILVSACLLGINCKYNGGNNCNEKVTALADDHELVPVCPEVLGGLPTPRVPSEIVRSPLNGGAGVVTNAEGVVVDDEFRAGAEEALRIAKARSVDFAILQSRSPSCGARQVYDGTFTRTLRPGRGVFAEALSAAGIRIVDVEDL